MQCAVFASLFTGACSSFFCLGGGPALHFAKQNPNCFETSPRECRYVQHEACAAKFQVHHLHCRPQEPEQHRFGISTSQCRQYAACAHAHMAAHLRDATEAQNTKPLRADRCLRKCVTQRPKLLPRVNYTFSGGSTLIYTSMR
eukprot:5602700-Amphidinium_carterae.1